jgi:hypothetical protein
MLIPSMLNMAEVMAESGYAEEDVFDCGISGQIVFLVVVPLVGACRVPVEALSHFMAGADDYTANRMPEHWSGALSGEWTIKRERLRILENSWNIFSDNCEKLAEALDAASQPQHITPIPAPVVVAALGGTTTLWTLERKTAARAMRDELRGQGKKAFAANTAAAFGVTPTRLREVLNDKPKKAPGKKTNGFWGE